METLANGNGTVTTTLVRKKSMEIPETSFPEMAYPSMRDHPLKSPFVWLMGKCKDDGAEGLWRVHDKLYDFTDMVERHPGGEIWLRVTKGTDITEAFESHHNCTYINTLIESYYIRDAKTKRNSPFTFEVNGFYNTLKNRVRIKLKDIPDSVTDKSKRLLDTLVFLMFAFSIYASKMDWGWTKVGCCLLAALFMTWTTTCSHNFVHQPDNWRMYTMNFAFTSTREFRIIHVLSHHLYPNTLMDAEMILFEPFINWLPRKSKSTVEKYGPRVFAVILAPFVMDIGVIIRIVAYFKYKNYSVMSKENLIPFILPLVMWILSGSDLKMALYTWLVIVHMASMIILTVSLHAAHHHPDIFHDGDTPKEDRDWGIHQLNAVMDRVDINDSFFKVMTNYGDHGLHHLFPALDHAILAELHPVFLQTCKEFNLELRMSNIRDMFVGSFAQMARTECIRTKVNAKY